MLWGSGLVSACIFSTLLSGSDTTCKFGDGCIYPCHCMNGATCDQDTGHCDAGCDDGSPDGAYIGRGEWHGPACQIGNVASDASIIPNEMSSLIDGNTGTDSCVVIETDGHFAKVEIDLGDRYLVTGVTLFGRDPSSELDGVEVKVKSTQNDAYIDCGSTGGEPVSNPVDVTCVPRPAFFVLITKQADLLTLCEIRITGYLFPEYTRKNGQICRFPFNYEGTTYYQCTRADYNAPWCYHTDPQQTGLWAVCVGGCPTGFFGPGCIMSCNCRDSCDVFSGCQGDCSEAWIGPDCQTQKPDYSGVVTATEITSSSMVLHITRQSPEHTLQPVRYNILAHLPEENTYKSFGSIDHASTGDLQLTATPLQPHTVYIFSAQPYYPIDGVSYAGTRGPDSANYITLCQTGSWGTDCSHTCRCVDPAEECAASNGSCPISGCKPGYTGVHCDTDCAHGSWGSNCSHRCNCDDVQEICVRFDGACDSGCPPGFIQTGCDRELPRIDSPPAIPSWNGSGLTLQIAPITGDDASLLSHYIVEIKVDQTSEWTSAGSIQGTEVTIFIKVNVSRTVTYFLRVTPVFSFDGETHIGVPSPEAMATYPLTSTIPSSTTKFEYTGIIAGGIVGFLVSVIAIVVLALLLTRKRRSAYKETSSGEENDTEVDLSTHSQVIDVRIPKVKLKNRPSDGPACSSFEISADAAAPPIYQNQLECPLPVHQLREYIANLKKVPCGFLKEYQQIPRALIGTVDDARKTINQAKDRFSDISAYDHSRVKLKSSRNGSDYINANHIMGYFPPDRKPASTEFGDESVFIENPAFDDFNEYTYASQKEPSTTESEIAAMEQGATEEANPPDDYVNFPNTKMENSDEDSDDSESGRKPDDSMRRVSSLYVNTTFMKRPTTIVQDDTVKNYIAAQGPLWNTREDFVQMVWQENANRIVMVTNLMEAGKAKCESYWSDNDDDLEIGDSQIRVIQKDVYADYVIREMIITRGVAVKRVRQFHFTGWPDHDVPEFGTSLIDFRHKVRSYDKLATGPMVVHCSAGVGRTGTFIALDYLLNQAEAEGIVDVLKTTMHLRLARVKMIQVLDQYVFVYDALLEAILSEKTAISCGQMKTVYQQLTAVSHDEEKSNMQEQFELLDALRPHDTQTLNLVGLKPENLHKNRSLDIIPRNDKRLILTTVDKDSTNYINAVICNGYHRRNAYIMTQIPLTDTVRDFWWMIWDHHVHSIILLQESILPECEDDIECYWPDEEGSSSHFGKLTVTYEKTTCLKSLSHVTLLEFRLTHESSMEERTIHQYTVDWSSIEEKPSNTRSQPMKVTVETLLEVLLLVGRWQRKLGSSPVIFQCRDGARLSGLICAAQYLLEKIEIDQEVDVFLAVKQVRTDRPSIIEDMWQYDFLHKLALLFIENNEIYANFK